jgi:hypothetical protein
MMTFLKRTALLSILISNYGIAMQPTANSFIDRADNRTYIYVENLNAKVRRWAGITRQENGSVIGIDLNGYDDNNKLLSIISVLAAKKVIVNEPIVEKIPTPASAENPSDKHDVPAHILVTTTPIELSGNESWRSSHVNTFTNEATGLPGIVIVLKHTDFCEKKSH